MLRLRTFGGALVESDAGPVGPAAGQRRVLALLSVVAASGSKGVTRDAILALLWPDSEPDKARQALNQAIYHTKRALGVEEIFQRGTDLRLDPEVIRADVAEFERLLDAGELDAALALYTGPFLDGFFVNGAPEFERWCSAQRTRLTERCAWALERLGAAADAAGNTAGAVEARRRRATLDPLNTRVAMDLVSALAAHGDRAGALQYARIHAELLRQELGIEPDPALDALLDRIREEPSPVLQVAVATVPPSGGGIGALTSAQPTSPPPDARVHEAAHETAHDAAAAATATRMPPRWSRRRVSVLAGAAGAVALLVTVMALGIPARAPESVRGRVVVAPFRVSAADRSLAYLREGMVELLSAKLAGDDPARTTDAGSVLGAWRRNGAGDSVESDRALALTVARRLGGERLLTGSVVGGPSRVVINAALLDVENGVRRAQASVEGSPDSLLVLVDRLAARLLAAESLAGDRLAEHTTTSLAALRAFLDGQAAFRRGRIEQAVRHYRFALDRDTTFALAALGLAQAAERIFDEPLRARALALAWSSRHELGERERQHLLALTGPRYPAPSTERERLVAWEQAASAFPDRADVWHALAERLYHYGRRLEVPDARVRARAAFERARSLDPEFAPPIPYLVQLAAEDGDARQVRQLAESYLQTSGDAELAHFVRWRVAHATGDSAALVKVRTELSRATVASLRAIAVVSLGEPWPLDDATDAIANRLARTVRSRDRGELLRGRHAIALNAGRPSEARAALEELAAMRAEQALRDVQPILDALYGDGDTTLATRAATRLDGREELEPLARCALAQWHANRGDFATARAEGRLLAIATDGGPGIAPVCVALIDAWAAVAERRPEAQRLLDRLDAVALTGPPIGDSHPFLGIAVARLHQLAGAPDRALAAVRRRAHMRAWPAYLATSLRLEGMLAEQLGEREAAARAWRHYLALRSDPEPQLAADAEEVRAALARVVREGS